MWLVFSRPKIQRLFTALDPLLEGVARRCGAIRTRAVERTTTLLLLRFRYHIAQN